MLPRMLRVRIRRHASLLLCGLYLFVELEPSTRRCAGKMRRQHPQVIDRRAPEFIF